MTEAEITLIVAEQIMGFVTPTDFRGYLDGGNYWMNSSDGFDPLRKDEDALRLIRHMIRTDNDKWDFKLRGNCDGWDAEFVDIELQGHEPEVTGVHSHILGEAIVYAALRAKGIEVE